MKSSKVRLPSKIHPLHRIRHAIGSTQKDFAARIGISPRLLQSIELGERKISSEVGEAIYLLTGILPCSWAKGSPKSTLGGKFDQESYQYWQMVCQDQNEEAPKRVIRDRVKALELIGKAMTEGKRGLLWEEDFRRFLLNTIQRYRLSDDLAQMKNEMLESGERWPEEAFKTADMGGIRANIATQILQKLNRDKKVP